MRRLVSLVIAVGTAGGALIFGSNALVASAATFRPCHDDSTISRNWTHGNPNVGLPSHNGYYYLDIVACSTHLVGRVVVLTVGSPPRSPSGESVTWGFEIKRDYNTTNLAAGNVTASGASPVEFTFDNAVVGGNYRFRVANNYDEVVTDHATFDSVTGGTVPPTATPTPTPTPTSTSSPTSSPTPKPTSSPTSGPKPTDPPDVVDSDTDATTTDNDAKTTDTDAKAATTSARGATPAVAELSSVSTHTGVPMQPLLAAAAAGLLAGISVAFALSRRRRLARRN
jgi:hypothetical protein